MQRRALLVLVCLALFVPSGLHRLAARPSARAPCVREGRGTGARGWIGCAADPGERRPLSGRERVLVGLPVDVNAATAEDLAAVPGFTARIAAEIVAERHRGGRFSTVDDLLRVRGIGPARLARARSHLAPGP